jgi:alkylated DNA repair dioxygenase AlkB
MYVSVVSPVNVATVRLITATVCTMAAAVPFPNLSNLNVLTAERHPRRALSASERVGDGVYCLDKRNDIDPCRSYVVLKRAAIVATAQEFDEAEVYFQTVVEDTPKMFGHPVTRRQCTFGSVKYGQYKLHPNWAAWPSLVHRAIAATQVFAAALGISNAEEYNSAQGNYYEDGGAGVNAHSDDEPQLVPGAPIFSYTFLKHNDNARAREFVIKRKPHPASGTEAIDPTTGGVNIRLESGDLLVMAGDMQADFNHELPKLKGEAEGRCAPRLNFTVRRFVAV